MKSVSACCARCPGCLRWVALWLAGWMAGLGCEGCFAVDALLLLLCALVQRHALFSRFP